MRRWRDWYKVESERFISTDVLRFLASAGIVAYHYLPHFIQIERYTRPWQLVFFSLSMMVDVFFIISGYVIYSMYTGRITDRASYFSFLRKRIARLVPLHYATLLFYLLVLAGSLLMGLNVDAQTYDLNCLPAQLTLTHAWGFCRTVSFNVPSWSISAEMAVYLAAPLLFLAARRSWLVWALVTASFVFGYYVADRTGLPRLHQRTADMGMLRAFPAFLFGVWLAQRPGSAWLAPLARLPLLPVFWLYLLAPLVIDPAWGRLMLAYLLATIAFARDAQGTASPLLRSIAPMGRLTYSLYMLHLPVAAVLVSLATEHFLHLEGVAKTLAVAATALVAVPVLSVMSLQLFELPARKLLSGPSRRSEPVLAREIAP